MPAALKTFILVLANILTFAIFVRAILSWFPISGTNPLVAVIYQITEPVLAPLRRVVPRIGMIDITPMAAIVLLQLVPFLLQYL
ncbi:MAG: YggT family protein [Chloroflexi bacterium]|nr:YggT family protein [Chloroflexota bacterium]